MAAASASDRDCPGLAPKKPAASASMAAALAISPPASPPTPSATARSVAFRPSRTRYRSSLFSRTRPASVSAAVLAGSLLVPLLGAVLPRDVGQVRLRAARQRRACRRILPDHRALASLTLGGSPFDNREARCLERADRVGKLFPDDVRRARHRGARCGGRIRA